jgi:predicted GIY-YIG superfamily endonuclease
MKDGYVYIMCNRGYGTLYVGITSDICRRAYEHRQSAIEGFSKKYGLHRFVYYEGPMGNHRSYCAKKESKKLEATMENRINRKI